jgi:hypothetical protein
LLPIPEVVDARHKAGHDEEKTSAGMTVERQCVSVSPVMAGHSRPKDGVLSHSSSWPGMEKAMRFNVMAGLVPAIHVFRSWEAAKTWMPATSAGMTKKRQGRA